MNEVLENIDIVQLMSAIWTIVLVPIITYVGTQLNEWLKSKRLDKYGAILYDEVVKAVKCIYQEIVIDLKNTGEFTEEKALEVKELAKTKAIQALSSSAYKCLKEANEDFEEYLSNLIESAVFDVKHQ